MVLWLWQDEEWLRRQQAYDKLGTLADGRAVRHIMGDCYLEEHMAFVNIEVE